MLKILAKIQSKPILHVDHVYIASNKLIVSGWYINRKYKGHIINVRRDLSIFLDGKDVPYEIVTYKRNDLEDEFHPSVFPENYGFVIKINITSQEFKQIKLKHGKVSFNINFPVNNLVNDIDVFVKQAHSDIEKIAEFLNEFLDTSLPVEMQPNQVAAASAQVDIAPIQQQCATIMQYKSLGIDWSAFAANNNIPEDENVIAYYMKNYTKQDFVVGDDFSSSFYRETYPDIAKSNCDPMLHYFCHGKNEGRVGSFQALFNQHYVGGKLKYNPELPSIAIVSHESSATGAPLVGLNLGLSIVDNYNVIHIVLHKSSLQQEFINNSVFILTHLRNKDNATIQMLIKWLHAQFNLDALICNSVETYPVLEAASELDFPIISLLHEFSEYTRPRGKITNTFIHSHKVVVPAKIIAESAYKEMHDFFGIKNMPNNIVVLPQGKLPFIPESNGSNLSVEQLRKKFSIRPTDKVIVGAGYVQMRKGVDLFIDAAAKIKKRSAKPCKFIWVGGGFEPEYDIGCSVWLQSQLEEFGLLDDFFFLNHQKSLDDVFTLADVYLLTSRLDPFPNVVIDALQADLPVVCFARTTGCAEFLQENQSNSAVVPFLDTSAMANKAVNFITKKSTKRNLNRQLVKEKLCFTQYVNKLATIIDEAKQLMQQRASIEATIIESKAFNTGFYAQGADAKSAIEYYVKTSLNGIHSKSPVPGFSNGKWFENHQPDSLYVVPLYEAIKAGQEIKTHECKIITGNSLVESKKKIAVHLHLYYFDLAHEFSVYFSCLPDGFDLYITVCESGLEEKVKAAFAATGASKIEVIEVENIGRDVAPFFISLKDKVFNRGYDIIGHFHSKKSNDVDHGTGDRWRKYLLSNLIGSVQGINEIFGLFEDPEIGLVFAEDSHNVDFGKNKSFSDTLCDAMKISRLECATIFPLGTMFWAKPDALAPLFELPMQNFLQAEPLPYDGSYMHATERLISHVVTETGYKFSSVYTQGTKW